MLGLTFSCYVLSSASHHNSKGSKLYVYYWGPALLKKHLNRIDKFLARAYRYRYTDTKYDIASIIEQKSKVLFSKISNDKEHVLYKLLPEEREKILRRREHNFILPQVKTERFKQSYVNRCLFNYFN